MITAEQIKSAADKKQRISVRELQQKNYEWIIAVDPNCSTDPQYNKSGIAVLNVPHHSLYVHFLTFPEAIEKLQVMKSNFEGDISRVLVLIEGGWLEKTNHHVHSADTERSAARKGRDVGRNQQTGILLSEMAQYMGYDVEIAKPLAKHWKGRNGKITHEELNVFVPDLPARTNEDERDAVLLAYHRAGFPLHEDPRAEYRRIMGGK